MPDDVLRVLTWNIRNLLGDPLAVHRALQAAAADVVCLQEAPRLLFTRNQLAGLARRSGMLYVTGGRASAGTALLAALRVDATDARAERLPRDCWRTHPRGFAAARVNLPGTRAVDVVSIHLGLSAAERAQHVRHLLADARASGVPTLFAGDLNEPPEGPSWAAFGPLATDRGEGSAPTFPAARPRKRIDAVLVPPELEVVDYGWPPGVSERDVVLASDHRPVLAQVRLPS